MNQYLAALGRILLGCAIIADVALAFRVAHPALAEVSNCQDVVRIRPFLNGSFDTPYIASSPTGSCDVRSQLVSDDGDFFLWHFCQWKTNSGANEVSLRNHKTGTFLATKNQWPSQDGSITCAAMIADNKATWHLTTDSVTNEYFESVSAVGFLSVGIDPSKAPIPAHLPLIAKWGHEAGGGQYMWNVWKVEDAISVPNGQWTATGTAQTSRDKYTTQTTYSKEFSSSSTTSFSYSFTTSIEEGFSFMGESEKTTFTETTAFSVSKTVSQTLGETNGYTFEHYCPEEVCDGKHTANIYLWQMEADVVGKKDPLQVTGGSNVIFAWTAPKCPPPLCIGVQCQECRKP